MKPETLKKALELEKEIKDLKSHRESFEKVRDNGGYSGIELRPDNPSYPPRTLFTKLLPITPENIATLYSINLNKLISDKEKEFENLKD